MRLAQAVHDLLGRPRHLGVAAYDGSVVLNKDVTALITVESPHALVRLCARPGELGLVRAYVMGDIDVDGDLGSVLELAFDERRPPLTLRSALDLLSAAGLSARDLWPWPAAPPEEVRRLRGRRHSADRDSAAVSHHYDVSNRFYELVLGPTMTYSCAVFATADEPLERAQRRKLDLICTKLGLQPEQRLLDVGCGWGELLIHAARHYGIRGVGITISAAQAAAATQRVEDAGLSDRVQIRLEDYRSTGDGPFDAISSIGMFEHVGRAQLTAYTERLYALLRDGGRLLHHAIGRPVVAGGDHPPTPGRALSRRLQVALGSARPSRIDSDLVSRYVFPDAELHELGDVVSMVQERGFEVRHVESLREHYAITLRRWVQNLDHHWDEACAEVGERRARVWRLYMSACAIGFDRHSVEVHQTLAVKPSAGGASAMPLRPDYSLRAGPRRVGASG